MNVNPTQSIKFSLEGRLFDPSGEVAGKQRFHVYDTDNKYLAYGKTGTDGRFYVEIKTPAALEQKVSLIFRICQDVKLVDAHPELGKDPVLCRNFSFFRGRKETAEVVETFVLDKIKKDIGEVHMEEPYEKEKVPLRYTFDILKAVIPSKFTSFIEKTKEKLDFFDQHDIGDVLKAYEVKGTPLTFENTWKLITNGICPLYLKEEGEFFIAEVNWDRYEFDKTKSLANIKVFFKKNDTKDPVLTRIDVQFRETLHPSSSEEDKTEVKTYLAEDENIAEGLRIANASFHVFGQTVYHLAIGHVYGSNAATAAYDYLAGHPLGDLLLPHCQFIQKISEELGRPVIFEEDGVLNASALSVKGIAHLISDSLASRDPFSFKPRTPINDSHVFAKVQNHHYSLLKEAVKEYFDEHWKEMAEDWKPVHGFFRTLFRRSPIYRPWEGDNFAKASWRDKNEIGGKEEGLPPREQYKELDEGVRSIRYIAKNVEGPAFGDREMMEDFIVDFIHHVTIWHSWIHRSQYVTTKDSPDVSDVNFAPLSLGNYGQGPYGGIAMKDAIHQLEVISIFDNFSVENYRLLEAKNVYPGIVKRVEAESYGYFENGIDPMEIQVSTVI